MAEQVFKEQFRDLVKIKICTTSAEINFNRYTESGTYEIYEEMGNGQVRLYFMAVDKSESGRTTQTRVYCGTVEYRRTDSSGVWTAWTATGGAARGKEVVGISKTATDGNTDTYTITYSDNSTAAFAITHDAAVYANAAEKTAAGIYSLTVHDVSPIPHPVQVRLRSKNLLHAAGMCNACFVGSNGLYTFTKTDTYRASAYVDCDIPAGVVVTFSAVTITGTIAGNIGFQALQTDGTYKTIATLSTSKLSDAYVLTQAATKIRVMLDNTEATGAYAEIFGLMIEVGGGTSYTDYIADFSAMTVTVTDEADGTPQQCHPNTDGDCGECFSSVHPTMTVTAEDGALVEVTYHRDMSKVAAAIPGEYERIRTVTLSEAVSWIEIMTDENKQPFELDQAVVFAAVPPNPNATTGLVYFGVSRYAWVAAFSDGVSTTAARVMRVEVKHCGNRWFGCGSCGESQNTQYGAGGVVQAAENEYDGDTMTKLVAYMKDGFVAGTTVELWGKRA